MRHFCFISTFFLFFTEDEDISSLNPNLLLYKSAGVHNLPVMCQAFALGASKSWTNENDLNRTALHQAILSVSELILLTIDGLTYGH